MFKALYWGNPHTVLSTLLLRANIGYLLWACARKAHIQRWGWSILLLILLHGVFCYFANIRDGYSNSIVHAIDGSTEMGLFSANSVQSIVFWLASIAIWLMGILAIFKPQVRNPVFFIMAAFSTFSIGFIEASRIWLYHAAPIRFTLL